MKPTHLMLARLPTGAFSVPVSVLETTPRKWREASGYGTTLSVEAGYVRASKREQNPELQRRELLAAGCQRIFEESISSRKECRSQLEVILDYCQEGDVLAVWQLDRLGRSIKEFIELVNGFKDRWVGFRPLRESLGTTESGGKLVFHVFASTAEFERGMTRERTMAGLAAARRKDRRILL